MKPLKKTFGFDNRRGCFTALIVTCAAAVYLLQFLAIAYLVWDILSEYFRMKALG